MIMAYNVGDAIVLDGIESVIVFDNGSEAEWGRYLCVDKNHDLVWYFAESDFAEEFDSNNQCQNLEAKYGYEWGFYEEQLPFASNSSNHVIGKGLETTNVIISNKDTTTTDTGGWFLLWDKVEEFRQEYSDKWFVPSIEELAEIYHQQNYLSNLSVSHSSAYWSSSEANSSSVYAGDFMYMYPPSPDILRSMVLKYQHFYRTRLCRYTTDSELDLLSKKTLQISTSTPEANIYYTTDNSTPTSSSNLYTNTFQANIGTTIKAIGIKEGYIDSDIAEFTVS